MVRYEIDLARSLVVAKFEQAITAEDVLGFFKSLESDANYAATMNGVADLRAARLNVTPDNVREVAEYAVAGEFKRGKWALLVNRPKDTAVSMIYKQVVGASYDLQVFSSVDGASEFLGLDLTPLLD